MKPAEWGSGNKQNKDLYASIRGATFHYLSSFFQTSADGMGSILKEDGKSSFKNLQKFVWLIGFPHRGWSWAATLVTGTIRTTACAKEFACFVPNSLGKNHFPCVFLRALLFLEQLVVFSLVPPGPIFCGFRCSLYSWALARLTFKMNVLVRATCHCCFC